LRFTLGQSLLAEFKINVSAERYDNAPKSGRMSAFPLGKYNGENYGVE